MLAMSICLSTLNHIIRENGAPSCTAPKTVCTMALRCDMKRGRVRTDNNVAETPVYFVVSLIHDSVEQSTAPCGNVMM